MSAGLCECGCGQSTPLATYTNARLGYRRGQPVRFISGHNNRGARNPRWNGGQTESNGYVLVSAPQHPRADHRGYVPEHILVAERALGRLLPEGAEVHHVNEVKSSNEGANLVICQDHAYHMLLHQRARAYKATGNPNARKCSYCKQWGTDLKLHQSHAYHAACNAAHVKAYSDGKRSEQ